jgi:hypothetical protein
MFQLGLISSLPYLSWKKAFDVAEKNEETEGCLPLAKR